MRVEEAIVAGFCEGRYAEEKGRNNCKEFVDRETIRRVISSQNNTWHGNWRSFKGEVWAKVSRLHNNLTTREMMYHYELALAQRKHYDGKEDDAVNPPDRNPNYLTWRPGR